MRVRLSYVVAMVVAQVAWYLIMYLMVSIGRRVDCASYGTNHNTANSLKWSSVKSCQDRLPPGFRARSWNRNLEPGEPPQNLDVEPEPAVTTGNLGPTVRNRNLEPIHGTCSVFLSCSFGADPCELFVWEKLLYAHLIADWPRHNFHENSKNRPVFCEFFFGF